MKGSLWFNNRFFMFLVLCLCMLISLFFVYCWSCSTEICNEIYILPIFTIRYWILKQHELKSFIHGSQVKLEVVIALFLNGGIEISWYGSLNVNWESLTGSFSKFHILVAWKFEKSACGSNLKTTTCTSAKTSVTNAWCL